MTYPSRTLRHFLCVAILLLPTMLLGQQDAGLSFLIRVTDFVTGKRLPGTTVFVGNGILLGHSTDRNGQLRLSNVGSESAEIMIDSSDWYLQGRVYRPGARALLPIDRVFDIRLLPGATVTGTIRDSARKPLANVHVIALPLTYDVHGRLAPPAFGPIDDGVVTNREGKFRIGSLPSGDYVLRLDPPDPLEEPSLGNGLKFYAQYFPAAASWEKAKVLHVESGSELNLGETVIDTRLGALIHIRLSDAIQPETASTRFVLEATSVSMFALPFSGRYVAVPSPGTLDLRLPYGEYTIEEASQSPRLKGKLVSDSTEKTVTLGPGYGQIRLKAQMTTGEDPPSNATPFLNLLSNSGHSFDLPGVVSIGIRGGRLAMDPTKPHILEAGTFRVVPAVSGDGLRVSGIRINDRGVEGGQFEVTPGSDTLLTVILSRDTTSLTGTVTDESGNAIPYAVIALLPDNRSQVALAKSKLSDAKGKFSIEAPSGDYHVFAWYRMDGYAHRNAEFMKPYDAKGTPVRIGAEPPAPVTLHPMDKRAN